MYSGLRRWAESSWGCVLCVKGVALFSTIIDSSPCPSFDCRSVHEVLDVAERCGSRNALTHVEGGHDFVILHSKSRKVGKCGHHCVGQSKGHRILVSESIHPPPAGDPQGSKNSLLVLFRGRILRKGK